MTRAIARTKDRPVKVSGQKPAGRPYPEPMEPMSIRLTRHQIDGLKKLAGTGLRINEIVRRAIDDYLEQKGVA